MIYFDNAATSRKKPLSVQYKTFLGTNKYSSNSGRSGHKLSLRSAAEIFKTRIRVKTLFNLISEDDIILTHNCTAALNLALLGTVKEGGHVIASCFEHNSVLRPLHELQKQGKITLTIISPKNKAYITLGDVSGAMSEKTYMICVNHITNTTGNKNDIYEIGKLCKEKNLIFVVDAAQSAGHIDVDVQLNNISFLAFAGHKGLFAPLSIGGLCINSTVYPHPIFFGGTGTNSIELLQPNALPEKYESGTLSTPLILGLGAGVDYVIKHFDKHKTKTEQLTKFLINKLTKMENVILYTDKNSKYGVILFNIKGKDSFEVSEFLNQNNIAVRGGLHCAPLAHQFLGTVKTGAVRVSLNHYNCKYQINKLIKILKTL